MWWCVSKGLSFEEKDCVEEGVGGGNTLPCAAFDADDDDALCCGNACGAVEEGFNHPFDVILWEHPY